MTQFVWHDDTMRKDDFVIGGPVPGHIVARQLERDLDPAIACELNLAGSRPQTIHQWVRACDASLARSRARRSAEPAESWPWWTGLVILAVLGLGAMLMLAAGVVT